MSIKNCSLAEINGTYNNSEDLLNIGAYEKDVIKS
jgi:hypothetical protein